MKFQTAPDDGSAVSPFVPGDPLLESTVEVVVPDVFPGELVLNGSLLPAGATDAGVRVFVSYNGADGLQRETEAVRDGLAFVARIPSDSMAATLVYRVKAVSETGCDALSEMVQMNSYPALDIIYVWNGSVQTGNFESAACWLPSSTPSFGYPRTPDARVSFADCMPGQPYEITIGRSVTNAAVVAGGLAAGSQFVFSSPDTSVEWIVPIKASAADLTVGIKRLQLKTHLANGSVAFGANNYWRVQDGGSLTAHSLTMRTRGCAVEISTGSRVGVVYDFSQGADARIEVGGILSANTFVFDASATADAVVHLTGSGSVLQVWNYMQNESTAVPTLLFSIPAEGYAEARRNGYLAPVTLQTGATSKTPSPYGGRIAVAVDKNSPALNHQDVKVATVPLVNLWPASVNLDNIDFGPMPKDGRGNRFVTLYDGTSSTTGTKASGVAAELHGAKGLVILLK